MSLFDLGAGDADDSPVFDDRLPIPPLEFDKSERLRAEKEMLGLYVSDHPLMGAEPVLRRHIECTIAERPTSTTARCATSPVSSPRLQRKYTKRGDLMATFVLEDLAAAMEVMVFPKTMLQYGELLESDAIVVLKARIDGREDTPKLIAMEISRPEINIDGAAALDAARQGARADRRRASRSCGSCCARTPGRARCSCASSGPRRRRFSASATSSAATRATASTPSSASSSAPTASRNARSRTGVTSRR